MLSPLADDDSYDARRSRWRGEGLTRTLVLLVCLAPTLAAGCNLIFGITGGVTGDEACQADRVPTCNGTPVQCSTSMLEPSSEAPSALAVAGDYVYWATGGTTIYRTLYNAASEKERVGSGGAIDGLAVDSARVYWCDYIGGTLYWASLDGSDHGVVASLATGTCTGRVAVKDGMVYFTSHDPPGVWRVAGTGGGSPEPIAAPGTVAPGDLVLDDTYLYWGEGGDGMTVTPSIRRIQIASIGTAAAEVFANLDAAPWRLAIDDDRVYWASWGGVGYVQSQAKTGGLVRSYLYSQDSGLPNAIVVDGSHVYWASVSGAIFAADKDGGSANHIATVAEYPGDLAVDCGALYVAIAQDAPDGGLAGGIFKVGKLP